MKKPDRNRKAPKMPPAEESDVKSGFAKILEIPKNNVFNVAQIELHGNREAVIDGICGILEYTENTIKLNTAKMAVKFAGRGLKIKCMTADNILIEGFITSIEFIT